MNIEAYDAESLRKLVRGLVMRLYQKADSMDENHSIHKRT